jgi:hypothetical protein
MALSLLRHGGRSRRVPSELIKQQLSYASPVHRRVMSFQFPAHMHAHSPNTARGLSELCTTKMKNRLCGTDQVLFLLPVIRSSFVVRLKQQDTHIFHICSHLLPQGFLQQGVCHDSVIPLEISNKIPRREKLALLFVLDYLR